MALCGRAVSQHLWLGHGAARLRAHRVGDLRCSRGELQLAIGAAGGGARRTGHPCREVLDGAGARRPAEPVVSDGLDRVSVQTEPADDAAGKSIPPACGLLFKAGTAHV